MSSDSERHVQARRFRGVSGADSRHSRQLLSDGQCSRQRDRVSRELNASLGEPFNSKPDRLGSEDPGPSGINEVANSTKIKTFWTFTSDVLFHTADVLPWSPKLFQPHQSLR